jgi:hypothetical protein
MKRRQNKLGLFFLLAILTAIAPTWAADIICGPNDFPQKRATAKPGDRILMRAGEYNIDSDVVNGITFESLDGLPTIGWEHRFADITPDKKPIRLQTLTPKVIINVPNGKFAFLIANNAAGKFIGLGFRNGGFVSPQNNGTATVIAEWCDIGPFPNAPQVGYGGPTAVGTGGHGGGGVFVASRFQNCRWHDGNWGFGIYRFDDLKFLSCHWVDVNNPTKSDNAGNVSKNLVIQYCYFGGTRRMDSEFQGYFDGFWRLDNWSEHARLSNNFHDNDSSFDNSDITHGIKNRNIHILRNFCYFPQRPDGTGMRLWEELGNGAEARDNWVKAIGTGVSVFMGDSNSANVVTSENMGFTYVENNRVEDAKWGMGSAYGPFSHQCVIRNNTKTQKLSWDSDSNTTGFPLRGRPLLGGGFEHQSGDGGPTTQPIPPVVVVKPAPVPNDGGVYVAETIDKAKSVNGYGPIEINQTNGEAAANDGQIMTMSNLTYPKGVGAHSSSGNNNPSATDPLKDVNLSRFEIFLNGKAARLRGTLGIDDGTNGRGSVIFVVKGYDGNEIYRSLIQRGLGAPSEMDVNVAGQQGVFCYTLNADGATDSDHADWANLRYVPATEVPPTTQPSGDNVDITTTTTTKIRNGKEESTVSVITRKAA